MERGSGENRANMADRKRLRKRKSAKVAKNQRRTLQRKRKARKTYLQSNERQEDLLEESNGDGFALSSRFLEL